MPCRSDFDDDAPTPNVVLNRVEKLAEARGVELDRVTKFLCTVLTNVFTVGNENLMMTINANKELSAWWKNHQEFDRKRNEAAKKRVPEILKIFQDLSEADQKDLLHKLKA